MTFRRLGQAAVFLVLTALTQVGGLAFLVGLIPSRRRRPWVRVVLVLAVYAGLSLVVVPPLAKANGRVPLPCWGDGLVRAPVLYCVLNRTYVVPEMREAVSALAHATEATFPGTLTRTLDGSFPFLTGFPLLPHLSHDDGRKLDLALHYEGGRLRSPLGYFAFEEPSLEQNAVCVRRRWLTLRWDLDWLQPVFPERPIDAPRQRFVLDWLAREGPRHGLSKVLVEPHLRLRLGVSSPILRFQGCRAARHDDHLHIQL